MIRDDHCPHCDTRLDEATSPEGLCPVCLMHQALERFTTTHGEQGPPGAAFCYPRPDMVLKRGTRLGRYEIKEPIGAGGMGEVFRATDTKLRRDVAVKVCFRTTSPGTASAWRASSGKRACWPR